MAEPNIIGEIKSYSYRLRWLGHLERMRENRAVKMAYLGMPKFGRPKYIWKDEVSKDLQELEVNDWHELD